jgi:hypothetical protein
MPYQCNCGAIFPEPEGRTMHMASCAVMRPYPELEPGVIALGERHFVKRGDGNLWFWWHDCPKQSRISWMWFGDGYAGQSGHTITSESPLTVNGSLLCQLCQDHGHIRDSKWWRAAHFSHVGLNVKGLEEDIRAAINRHSAENASNTPDHILARYLLGCLAVFNVAVQQRETWYGRDVRPSNLTPCTCGGAYGEPHGLKCPMSKSKHRKSPTKAKVKK